MGRVVSTKAISSVSIALVVVVVTKGGDCVWNGTSLQTTPSSLWQEQQSVETRVGTCLGTLIPPQGVYCSMDNHQGGWGLSGFLKGCCAERWFDTAEGLFKSLYCSVVCFQKIYTNCKGELHPDHVEPLYSPGECVELTVFMWALPEGKHLETDNLGF